MHPKTELLRRLLAVFQETDSILIVSKDGSTFVPPVSDMVQCPGPLYPQRSRHGFSASEALSLSGECNAPPFEQWSLLLRLPVVNIYFLSFDPGPFPT